MMRSVWMGLTLALAAAACKPRDFNERKANSRSAAAQADTPEETKWLSTFLNPKTSVCVGSHSVKEGVLELVLFTDPNLGVRGDLHFVFKQGDKPPVGEVLTVTGSPRMGVDIARGNGQGSGQRSYVASSVQGGKSGDGLGEAEFVRHWEPFRLKDENKGSYTQEAFRIKGLRAAQTQGYRQALAAQATQLKAFGTRLPWLGAPGADPAAFAVRLSWKGAGDEKSPSGNGTYALDFAGGAQGQTFKANLTCAPVSTPLTEGETVSWSAAAVLSRRP